jgi:hypothetical protein
LWLKKGLFSASTFVVQIATFAKPQTVMGKLNKNQNQDGLRKPTG